MSAGFYDSLIFRPLSSIANVQHCGSQSQNVKDAVGFVVSSDASPTLAYLIIAASASIGRRSDARRSQRIPQSTLCRHRYVQYRDWKACG